MPTLAYFDTNIFSHLQKKSHGVTQCHETALRAAVESGKLRVIVGLHAIDETAANPRDPAPELRLIYDLCDWDRVVKPTDILLEDDVRHFAYNGESSHPFLHARSRDAIRQGVLELLSNPSKLAELHTLLTSVRPQRKEFRRSIQELKRATQAHFLEVKERQQVGTFNDYFDSEAALRASELAERVGLLEECQRRAADEFLKLRSVRMAAGSALSYIWAVNVENWEIKPSDGLDFQHAIAAAGSGVDFFVTHDADLATLVERVPIKGLKTVGLRDLLDEITKPGPL